MTRKKIPQPIPAKAEPARALLAKTAIPEALAFKKVQREINPLSLFLSKEFLDDITGVAKQIMTVFEGFAKWAYENREAIETWRKIFETFEEELKDLDATQKKALIILKQYRWILTPSTLPLLMTIPVVKIGKEQGDQSEKIDALFTGHFIDNNFENLKEMVEGWSDIPIFKDRLQFFRDSVAILANAGDGYNPSNIIIPTLIAQIDGIQIRFMVESGLTPENDIATRWKRQDGRTYAKAKGKKDFFEEEASNQPMFLSDDMKSLASNYMFEDLFADALPFKNAPSNFNRHKIEHGEIVDYGTIPNTIRAFLILDFLAHLCKKLEEPKAK